jgi:hypothetical protein
LKNNDASPDLNNNDLSPDRKNTVTITNQNPNQFKYLTQQKKEIISKETFLSI